MKYIVTVRGMLKGDEKQAQQAHDAIVGQVSPLAKSMGDIAHQAYLNPQNPNEFFAIDIWDNLEGLQKLYGDPKVGEAFGQLFQAPPDITIWKDSGWFGY